jgi:gluconolactonase
MTEVVIEDDVFASLVAPGSEAEFLGGDCIWSEGPAWLPWRRAVIWSDIPNDRVMRWTEEHGVEVERDGVEYTNGRFVDHDGGIVTCSHGNRRIERWNQDGSVTPLVTHYQGRRLNSPNDVVVKSDRTVWFTDPPYGILSDREGHAAEPELPGCYVFRFDPATRALTAVTDWMSHPNGLAFSPDESVLYVSDTSAGVVENGNHHIVAFDVVGGIALDNPRLFAVFDPGVADGLRVDVNGYLFTSAHKEIHVLSPDGHRIGRIPLPEVVANCTFGGPDGSNLFIVATSGLYRIRTQTRDATTVHR